MFDTETLDSNAVLKALGDLLRGAVEQKHTTPAGTPSTPYMHGPGGLFGVAGLERDIISTRVQPEGLASVLPMSPDIDTDPLYPYITGFYNKTGTVAADRCDDPEVAGAIKTCFQTAQFGRYSFMTRESDVTRIGQRTNRGEFMDLRHLNSPLVSAMGGMLQQRFALSDQAAALAGADMLMRFVEVGVSFQNELGEQVYIGNPANNNAGGGYTEFPGLDILIGVNKVDAISGTDCPSLDSDIKDMNYSKVGDVNAANNIVNVVTYLMRILRANARTMRFGQTRWSLVMRETLFYELTAVWPCNYATYRCIFPNDVGANGEINLNVDSGDMIRMRDAMRNGRFLIVDGRREEVILDDFIAEESSADTNRVDIGCFASDIYVVPRTVRGGTPVTYWEYYDYQAGTIPAIQQGNLTDYFWSDGGRFLWHAKPPKNFCVQHLAVIEPRIILLTPHLAGRITNVQYCPLQHTRDPLPDQDYFVDGGVQDRDAPSHYSDWNLPD